MPNVLRGLWGRITEIHEQDWQNASGAGVAATAAFAFFIAWSANSGSHWVIPLDNANLAFHEFGHPFFGGFAERLAVYGGTLGQLMFPLIAALAFWVRREAVSCAVCAIWFSENLFNIARYMADARAHQLPLVGGLNPELYHDWTEIFVRRGVLRHDLRIAAFFTFCGWIGILGAVGWLAWIWYRQREDN
jgi:hypothetical protein